MPYEPLDRTRLTQALRRLGQLAVSEGVELELSLYGGAVFTLVYGSRDSTKDVDALIQPSDIGRRLARQVASEQALPDDWINADVAQFLAEREEILKHKWLESERLGYDIGFERALLDWIRKHRDNWRASRRPQTAAETERRAG